MNTNTSATGGYLLPANQFPLPANLSFKQFLQQVFVGLSGLPGNLVFPRWQVAPPKQPDLYTNWMSIGVTSIKPDANGYTGVLASTQAQGTIEILCNPQPLDTLTLNGIAITFVSVLTTGNQVLIGTTAILTTTNLQAFLSQSSISSLTVAAYVQDSNVITITYSVSGAGNSYTLAKSPSRAIWLSGATLSGGGTQVNQTQRHEELEIGCSFYGPNSAEYCDVVRDGFQVQQNLEGLRSVNMGFVGTDPAMQVPDLVNERWVDRFEMVVHLRREILRTYPILTLVSVSGSITAELSQGSKTVNFGTS